MSWWTAFWHWLCPWWYNQPPESARNIRFEVREFYKESPAPPSS